MKRLALCLASALCGLFVTSAPAAIISTATSGGTGTFSVSGTDLANSNQATFSSAGLTAGTANFGSSVPALFEGTMYADAGAGNTEGLRSLTPSDNAVLVISLNTALNPAGYDIGTINTFTGTAQSRSGQAYDVAISNVGAPNTFIPLYSVTSALANNVDAGTGEVRVSTVQNAGNLLLGTGVAKVQFTFHDCCASATVDNSMFREIDLIGNATGVAPPPVVVAFDQAFTNTSQIDTAAFGPGTKVVAAVNLFNNQFTPGGQLGNSTILGISFDDIDVNGSDRGGAAAVNGTTALVKNKPGVSFTKNFETYFDRDAIGANIGGTDGANATVLVTDLHPISSPDQGCCDNNEITLSGLDPNTRHFIQMFGGDEGWGADVDILVNGGAIGRWTSIADNITSSVSTFGFFAMSNAAGVMLIDLNTVNVGGPGNPQFAGISGLIVTQAAAAAVPEPASLSLIGMGALALLRRRRNA